MAPHPLRFPSSNSHLLTALTSAVLPPRENADLLYLNTVCQWHLLPLTFSPVLCKERQALLGLTLEGLDALERRVDPARDSCLQGAPILGLVPPMGMPQGHPVGDTQPAPNALKVSLSAASGWTRPELPSRKCIPWETRAPSGTPGPRRVLAQPRLWSVLATAWPAHPFLWGPQCQGGGPVNNILLCSGLGRGWLVQPHLTPAGDPTLPCSPLLTEAFTPQRKHRHPTLSLLPAPRQATAQRSGVRARMTLGALRWHLSRTSHEPPKPHPNRRLCSDPLTRL